MAALPSRRLAQSPLLTIAVSLSTGIVLGHFFAGESATLLSASLAGLALISTVSVVCLSRRRFTAASITVVVAFVAGGMVLSLLGSRPLRASRISRMYDEGVVGLSEPVELAGTIDGEPEPAPQSFYLRVKAERLRLRGTEREAEGMVLLLARLTNEQIKAEYDALELRHGARIRLLVTLDREDEFRNPGVMPITEYLEHQGYDATGVIKSPLLIERLNDDRVFLPLAWLYDWRQSLQQRFRHLFSPETAGVLGAAILGNKYNISPGA
ncbi:MAG TPA: DUF4131 domain-containing protein, partial [Pyrinomonadaceae bacterium]|nr:DUF4131 domain-containing protein [Pyrinomonadaceae bacterium]